MPWLTHQKVSLFYEEAPGARVWLPGSGVIAEPTIRCTWRRRLFVFRTLTALLPPGQGSHIV
jgi:hypothetical protein